MVFGHAKANDDLKELAWISVKELNSMMQQGAIAKEHHVLVNLLMKNLND